jgi:stage II sporulation protein D
MRSGKNFYFIIFIITCFDSKALDFIKVKINAPEKKISLFSKEEMKVSLLGKSKRSKKMIINCDFKSRQVFSKSLVASVESNAPIRYDGKYFKGKFDIIARERDGCEIINTVKFENYVSSLLSKEMNKSWPIEALKAQAIAARSYALSKFKKSIGETYHIESSEREQVSGSYSEQNENTDLAAYMTKDLILVDDKGRLVEAYYHAMCGGKILDPNYIWDGYFYGFEKKQCRFCHKYKKNGFQDTFSKSKLIKKLHQRGYVLKSINQIKNLNEHILFEEVGPDQKVLKISKKEVRRSLKNKAIRSFNFDMKIVDNKVYLKGFGHGHGVGMCQMGALAMAEQGKSYKEILSYYYPNFRIVSKGELQK